MSGDPAGEAALLAALRAGDEVAFTSVVLRWSPAMLRVARGHLSTDASAQEVVQDAWVAVIRGLDTFEGLSSLRTWVFRILVNVATTRGVRESRVLPAGSFDQPDASGPTVDPSRFAADGAWAGGAAPRPCAGDPAAEALRGEVRALLGDAIAALPARQRAVVVLRDVEGLPADQVCRVLDLTPENQRLLLHRGRARLRAVLEVHHHGPPAPPPPYG